MKHLSPWWKKKGATAVKRKWCHGNISVPIAHGDTGAKEVGVSVSCKDGGVLPDCRFPRYGGMAIEERAKTSLGHGAHTSNSYNTCIRTRASPRGYTFEACVFGADRVGAM